MSRRRSRPCRRWRSSRPHPMAAPRSAGSPGSATRKMAGSQPDRPADHASTARAAEIAAPAAVGAQKRRPSDGFFHRRSQTHAGSPRAAQASSTSDPARLAPVGRVALVADAVPRAQPAGQGEARDRGEAEAGASPAQREGLEGAPAIDERRRRRPARRWPARCPGSTCRRRPSRAPRATVSSP